MAKLEPVWCREGGKPNTVHDAEMSEHYRELYPLWGTTFTKKVLAEVELKYTCPSMEIILTHAIAELLFQRPK